MLGLVVSRTHVRWPLSTSLGILSILEIWISMFVYAFGSSVFTPISRQNAEELLGLNLPVEKMSPGQRALSKAVRIATVQN